MLPERLVGHAQAKQRLGLSPRIALRGVQLRRLLPLHQRLIKRASVVGRLPHRHVLFRRLRSIPEERGADQRQRNTHSIYPNHDVEL